MTLKIYNKKRDFEQTAEPPGKAVKTSGPLRFVVQMHAASRLHFDFRLEMDGVLKSWAVPRGPSLNPQEHRLAVYVEDHPIEYGSFEGIIPKGNYGAGSVMVWDQGTYVERGSKGRDDSEKAMLKGLANGHITFVLEGEKLRGEFALIRFKTGDEKSWLLVKKRDEHATYKKVDLDMRSVKTGRTMKEIAANAEGDGHIWLSKREAGTKAPPKSKKSFPNTPKTESKKNPTPESLPRRLKPLLPSNETEAFDQKDWLFEKFTDGPRVIAEVEPGRVHMHSRQLLPFDKKYPDIATELRHSKKSAVLDGEIVKEDGKARYYVFDLLHFDGKNLRNLPLELRKKRLSTLPIFNDIVRYRDHTLTKGTQLYEDAQKEGTPALLAKDVHSIYKPGVSRYWRKIEVKGTKKEISKLEKSAQVFTHTSKIFFPEDRITKGDVIEYYRQMSDFILPYLKDRPESLNRHPHGIHQKGFYQKDVIGHLPRFVETCPIFSESANKYVNYLVCQNQETLLYMANLGCIELNPWLSRIENLDHPDFLVIDLDPDDSNTFKQVVEAARETHKVLEAVGAISFCKTSGATGMHICIPTGGRHDYETVRTFAETICTIVHQRLPKFTSIVRSPAKRRGKIYLDFLQNSRGQTLAAPYCLRPRVGAPVSTPLSWSEVTAKLSPQAFTIKTIFKRLDKLGDLWRPVLTSSVNLRSCIKEAERLLNK